MNEIWVEATEDIKSYSLGVYVDRNGYLIAKKGRQGWVDISDFKKLSKNYPYDYVDVVFDGNKIRRSVPNKSLKLVGV